MIRLLSLLLFLAFPAHAAQIEAISPCGYSVVGFYDSGNKSERYTQVVLGGRYVIFNLIIDDVWPGDVLDVIGDAEVTTPRNTNTEFVTQLLLYHGGSRWEISEENGVNIDLDRHHEKVVAAGWIEVPDAVSPSSRVVIWWRWGAFDGGAQPRWLAVGGGYGLKDYGRLTARHYRPGC